jgi:capsid protein
MVRAFQWLWIRIRRSTAEAAVHALGERSDAIHREAMVEFDTARRDHLRKEADYYADEQKEIRDALMDAQNEKPK